MKTVTYTTYDVTDDIVSSVISLVKTNKDAIADVISQGEYIMAITDGLWELQHPRPVISATLGSTTAVQDAPATTA